MVTAWTSVEHVEIDCFPSIVAPLFCIALSENCPLLRKMDITFDLDYEELERVAWFVSEFNRALWTNCTRLEELIFRHYSEEYLATDYWIRGKTRFVHTLRKTET